MTIDPEATYSFAQLVSMGHLGKSEITVAKRITQDRLGKNLLKVKVTGEGPRSRYFIQGKNLLAYLQHHDK